MNNDQKANGMITPAPNSQSASQSISNITHAAIAASQTQQPNQVLASGQPTLDPTQLLINPQTAAMVATVVAAAAQQMAQQHQGVQVVQPSASQPTTLPTAHQQTQHPTHAAGHQALPPQQPSSVAPIPSSITSLGLSHLGNLMGLSQQPPAVFQKGAPVAQAQVVAAVNGSGGISAALLSNMQNWKLDQLEAHVQMLRETNQAIPQPIAMLLADARRKEEKRTAKRVANRKSACTSRARKKALVEEMTRTNARLKRQALILALLPDLVIAITTAGEITFCSAQVERVLRHKIDDLIGANLCDLLIPASRSALTNLIGELAAAERAAAGSRPRGHGEPASSLQAANAQNESKEGNANENANALVHASVQSSSEASNGAAVVSDQSFPLSVVQVEKSTPEENSDLSTKGDTHRKDKQSSSDDSLSSSSDAKNLRNANANLSRNVRWHNENLKSSKAGSAHKDDVTGEAVTPNNAGARLSSLQHRPKTDTEKKLDNQEEDSSSSSDSLLAGVEEKKKSGGKNGNGSSSDESGYRESNESAREDSSSSASDMSQCVNGRRKKPLAPTCNICLICDDLTTIWCEVTSSIRTRSLKDEAGDSIAPVSTTGTASNGKGANSFKTNSSEDSLDNSKDEIKELLLCLRPIRDGEEKVNESLRFLPGKRKGKIEGGEVTATPTDAVAEEPFGKGPMKKRPLQQNDTCTADVTTKISRSSASTEQDPPSKKLKEMDGDAEKSVVESLMLMGSYDR